MLRKVLLRRFLMGLIAFALVLGGFCFFREVTSKQDAVNTMHNLRKVYNALEEYQKEHGHYPPQQDMHSLMQTLKISGKDLFKTSFIDIRTARYTAPQKNSKEPILQLHVPRRWYDSRSQSFIIREIGTVENQPGSSMPGADKLR